MFILAIDPGNVQSAYCLIRSKDMKPIQFDKIDNEELLSLIPRLMNDDTKLVIEMIASYGMSVGKTVFETCVWIGRFIEAGCGRCEFIYRAQEKMNLCHTMKAKDSNIRQALIDRFGVVGTKKNPGWFYGFKKDVWSAYAVGITFLDIQNEGKLKGI